MMSSWTGSPQEVCQAPPTLHPSSTDEVSLQELQMELRTDYWLLVEDQ